MIACEKERCYSPVACGAFGYCRELNLREAPRSPSKSVGLPVAELQALRLCAWPSCKCETGCVGAVMTGVP